MCAQQRLWSAWASTQADLSLRWVHMPFCWFCHEAAHLILSYRELRHVLTSFHYSVMEMTEKSQIVCCPRVFSSIAYIELVCNSHVVCRHVGALHPLCFVYIRSQWSWITSLPHEDDGNLSRVTGMASKGFYTAAVVPFEIACSVSQ